MTKHRPIDGATYTRKQDGKRHRTVAVAVTFRTPAAPLGAYVSGLRLSTLVQLAVLALVVAVNVVLLV